MNLHAYSENVLWSFDVLLNAIAGGRKRQTVSDRIGDFLRRGRLWAKAADWLFFGHFAATDEADKHPLIFDSSTALAILGAVVLAWLWAGWEYPVIAMRIQQVFLGALLVLFLGRLVRKLWRIHVMNGKVKRGLTL